MPTEAPKVSFETHTKGAMDKFVQSIAGEMQTLAPPAPAANGDPPAPVETPKPEPEPKPPVTPAAPAEPKPEAGDRPWPRSAKDWDAYKKADKERLDKLGTERDEWRKKYEEGEKRWKENPAIPPDYETVKKERDQLDQQLKTTAVENHPKFKAYFESKTKEQLDLAERIGGENGKEIVELLKAPDGQWKDQRLTDLLAGLSPLQSSRIASVMNNLSQIANERQQAIEKAREGHDQLLKQEQDKARERQDSALRLFDEMSAEIKDAKNGNLAYQPRDGDQKWNEAIAPRIEAAKALLFGKQEPRTMIRAAFDALSLPVVLEQTKALMQENDQLKSQIKELQAAQPTVTASGNRTESAAPVRVQVGRVAHGTPQDAAAGFMKTFRQGMEEPE